ncbi:MAG: hypothetical protein ABUJ92_00340 [Desulfobacterales bacterium]
MMMITYRLYVMSVTRPRQRTRDNDMPVMGIDIGPWLIKTFGLPKTTTKFTLHSVFDELVRVECEYYPDINTDEAITKQFGLVEVEAGKEAEDDGQALPNAIQPDEPWPRA